MDKLLGRLVTAFFQDAFTYRGTVDDLIGENSRQLQIVFAVSAAFTIATAALLIYFILPPINRAVEIAS